jgi:hemerythrin
VELVRNLHELMRAWIQEHILKIDTQLRPCIGFRSKS